MTISIHHFREPATESLDGRFTLAKSVELVQAILALVEDHFYSDVDCHHAHGKRPQARCSYPGRQVE